MKLAGALVLLSAALVVILVSQPASLTRAGKQSDGSFLLVNGWRIKPAGRQIQVDTFPMSTALSRDHKLLLVLNGGYNPPSISVVDTDRGAELSRTRCRRLAGTNHVSGRKEGLCGRRIQGECL